MSILKRALLFVSLSAVVLTLVHAAFVGGEHAEIDARKIAITRIPYKMTGGVGEVVALLVPRDASVKVLDLHRTPRTVAEAAVGAAPLLVINGGYFADDYAPSGYLVSEGKRVGDRAFDTDKSGLFIVKDGRWDIRYPARVLPTEDAVPDDAVQSYPILVRGGAAAISVDSGKVARRSAVGVAEDGGLYFIVSDQPLLSLHDFAVVLAHGPIRFRAVLNLDGGLSTGVVADTTEGPFHIDSRVPVGNVIVVR